MFEQGLIYLAAVPVIAAGLIAWVRDLTRPTERTLIVTTNDPRDEAQERWPWHLS